MKADFNYAMPGYWEWIVKTPVVRAIFNEAIRRQTIRDVYFYDSLIVPGIFNWQTRDMHIARKSNQCKAYTVSTLAHEVYHSLQELPTTFEDLLLMEQEAYTVTDMTLVQLPSRLFKGGAKTELKAARKHRKNFRNFGPAWSYDWAEFCLLQHELKKVEDEEYVKAIENPPRPFYWFKWGKELIDVR